MALCLPDSCRDCPLWKPGATGFTEPEGSGSLRLLIVGEASGASEADDGLPFRPYAESGSVLERVWTRLGTARDQYRITNVVRCRPPGNELEGAKYEVAAIQHCDQYLSQSISDMAPAAILALGGIAARTLTGLAGPRLGIQSIRGFPVLSPRYSVPVVGGLHPAFLRRGKMSWLSLLINDMDYARELTLKGMPARPPAAYVDHPTVKQVEAFRDWLLAHPQALLAFDIETNWSLSEDENEVHGDGSEIVLVQFSVGKGAGIAIPWERDYLPLIQELLASPNPKVGHNAWLFDIPMLKSKGMQVRGRVDDSMWAWHHLQPDLPRGLQAVASLLCPEFGPWKHEVGADLHVYGCKDVDILHWIWPKIVQDLKSRHNCWQGYERHVYQLRPILDRMTEHGIPIDPIAQASFRDYLQAEMEVVDGRLQSLYPEALREPHPAQGFARTPADTTGLAQRTFSISIPLKVPCSCVTEDGEIPKRVENRTPSGEKFELIKCPQCKGKGLVKSGHTREESQERWCRLLPFKASPKQLIRYMRSRGHKVPKAIGRDKDTTDKLHLERLAKETRDPLYADLLLFRAYQKQEGSYIWAYAQDEHCHPTFTYSPATGQLAATNPNVLTIPAPKGKKTSIGYNLALKFRKTIAAKPGYALLAIDFSAFHASTFAWEARDPDYFRLANIIADPHSFLTAILLRLNTADKMLAMQDDELRAYLDDIKSKYKPIRDGQAKPAILGYALGLGGNKLFEQNRFDPDTGAGFRHRSEADSLLLTLRRTFPKGVQYQNAIRLKAHVENILYNPFGYLRWFWDVIRHNPRTGETEPGDQSEAAIAFNVQADAHGHLKEALLRMEAQGWLERYGLCNVVHDEVFFECQLALLEEALANLLPEMEKPSEILRDPVIAPGGLVVRAAPSIGWNRAEMMSPAEFFDNLRRKS